MDRIDIERYTVEFHGGVPFLSIMDLYSNTYHYLVTKFTCLVTNNFNYLPIYSQLNRIVAGGQNPHKIDTPFFTTSLLTMLRHVP